MKKTKKLADTLLIILLLTLAMIYMYCYYEYIHGLPIQFPK